MPKMIYICILLIYFKVISKKGGHYCPRLPYGVGANMSRVRSIHPNLYGHRAHKQPDTWAVNLILSDSCHCQCHCDCQCHSLTVTVLSVSESRVWVYLRF